MSREIWARSEPWRSLTGASGAGVGPSAMGSIYPRLRGPTLASNRRREGSILRPRVVEWCFGNLHESLISRTLPHALGPRAAEWGNQPTIGDSDERNPDRAERGFRELRERALATP